MENVLYTSLAIGETYLNNFIDFCYKKSMKDNSSNIVVTNKETLRNIENYQEITNIEFIILDDEYQHRNEYGFNYNLKFKAIKESLNKNKDYVIYVDSDFRIRDGYNVEKFKNLFFLMETNDIDYVFERPYLIYDGKVSLENNFWKHKIIPYKLNETTKYDNYHVCNEQFLVFKNNDKLTIFSDKWEELYWKSVKENIWTFAEGLEIGMSSADANMSFNFHLFRETIYDCFEFNDPSGNLHVRF